MGNAPTYAVRPLAQTRSRHSTLSLTIVMMLVAFMIYVSLTAGAITDLQGFMAYTLLLLLYLLFELRTLRKTSIQLFWINPALLASVFFFGLRYGATNALVLLPEDTLSTIGISPEITPWMNRLMLLVLAAAGAMWTGYDSGIGLYVSRRLKQSRTLRRVVSSSNRVNTPMVWIFLAISLAANLWAIQLGVYGYASIHDQLFALASIREYLNIGSNLGEVALVGVAIQCFAKPRSAVLDRLLLCLILGYEILFGVLSGFKSAIVMPIVIVAVVYYTQRERIPRWGILAFAAALMVSYSVIDPARAVRNADTDYQATGVSHILSMGSRSAGTDAQPASGAPKLLQVLQSSNQTFVGSAGIEFAAVEDELPPGSPTFLRESCSRPLEAIIPRVLWKGKKMGVEGQWYTTVVLHKKSLVHRL